MKRNLLNYTLTLMLIVFTSVLVYAQSGNKTTIPSEYKEKVNPHKGDESLKMTGLRTFNRHCVSCHGKAGLGDGVMSKNLKIPPGNLTTAHMTKYSDGEIYYMSFVGEGERPDFIKLIPSEEDKWAVVNYVRTLQKE
ncbi:MAG: cytochrome c [Prolixibacteraceae bacterium]|nr:cytochrome c [Prolixibacteraceae bacterium]